MEKIYAANFPFTPSLVWVFLKSSTHLMQSITNRDGKTPDRSLSASVDEADAHCFRWWSLYTKNSP